MVGLSIFPGLKYFEKTHYLRFVCRTALGFVVSAVKTLTFCTNPVKFKRKVLNILSKKKEKPSENIVFPQLRLKHRLVCQCL